MDSLTLDLVKPIRNRNGSFENPFKSSISFPGGGRVCKFLREKFVGAITGPRAPTQQEINENLPVTKPDLQRLNSPPVDKLQYIWIGHATMLYQTDGWNILSDPIWSERCSPFSFLGPKRYRPPPLPMEDLPRIDAVVISHNHYDHLDIHSVTTLNKLFGKSLHWLVPEGLKGWFLARNCETVTELSWWQSVTLKMEGKKDLEITCTPAQHWSLRSGCDRNQSLWSSWVMKSSKHSIWFSGDTGFCEVFETIGQKYGPFDLSAIAIGAYCPRYMMANQHINPEEALQIHRDLRSRLSVGIHWGTFPMGSTEPYLEPRELIASLQGTETKQSFITVSHGSINIAE